MRVETAVDVAVRQVGTGMMLASRGINCVASIGQDHPKNIDVDIRLQGALSPQDGRIARLRGTFEYTTAGRLVGPLLLIPDSVLSVAATAVNTGILQYARGRFVNGIVDAYSSWLRQHPSVR